MKSIESLDAWKVSFDTAESVYRLTLIRPMSNHYSLADQMRRAAASIPANVAEGYGLGTRAQLVRHLRIALGSAAELNSHLTLAANLGLLAEESTLDAKKDLDRTTSLLIGLLRSLGARV